MFEKASADAIDLSGGTPISQQEFLPVRPGKLETPDQEVYYRETARLYKKKVTIPLILVEGIRSYEVAEELVQSGTADYVALGRPLICEPGLVKRWHEGERRKAECISCNLCFGAGLEGKGVYCVAKAGR